MALNEVSRSETLLLPNGAAPMEHLKFHFALNIRLDTWFYA